MNETPTALGSWPNAPLALVLAQVRYAPTSDTAPDLVLERIKRAAGPQFSSTQNLHQITLMFGPIGQADALPQHKAEDHGYNLRTQKNDEAFILNPGVFSFMTAAYVDSSHFAERWKSFMAALFNGNELQIDRIGLRYIDFIIPSKGHVPEDYFQEIGRSPSSLGKQSEFATSMFDFLRDDGGRLRVQYFRGEGDPELPPDLQGGVIIPAHRPRHHKGDAAGVLDMDRWRPVGMPLSSETTADAIIALREDIARSFRNIMTELAHREWAGLTARG
ncbi:hypothetical protein GALL_158050 [mine drainage metagenome]|uniref:TIGR04255 family protein n=1 Tax=mine drainage metagenome TaxID=410659 RepID=A0A1J5S1C2_9ZZZZ